MSSSDKLNPDRESVAEIVLALAHDCSNLLAVAELSARSAARDVNEGTRAHTDLTIVREVIDRIGVIMQRIRVLSRKDALVPELLSLNDIVRYVSSILRPLFGEGVDLTLKLDPALPTVEADRLQVEQVVLNLLLNAREAIAPRGQIAVETAAVVIDKPNADGGRLPQGEYAHLAVIDSGPGMSEATMAQAFEPFFTTKLAGRGSGLGLAGSRRIIEHYGGLIVLQSEPGRGTRVEVFLPARIPAALPGLTRGPSTHRQAPEARASHSRVSRS
jgi:two-component system cell cycle sensor histidine kinase/response regulator CckA